MWNNNDVLSFILAHPCVIRLSGWRAERKGKNPLDWLCQSYSLQGPILLIAQRLLQREESRFQRSIVQRGAAWNGHDNAPLIHRIGTAHLSSLRKLHHFLFRHGAKTDKTDYLTSLFTEWYSTGRYDLANVHWTHEIFPMVNRSNLHHCSLVDRNV